MRMKLLILILALIGLDVAQGYSKNKYDLCRRTSKTGYGDYAWGETGTTTTPCPDNYQTPESWNSKYHSSYNSRPWCFYNAYYIGDNSYYVCCYDLYASGCPSITSEQPTACKQYDIETQSWSLKMSVSYLGIWMNKSTSNSLYAPVKSYVDDLNHVTAELEQIAKDKSSCQFISQFFLEVVRPSFEQLKKNFLLAHNKALDPRVGQSWQSVESDYQKLRSTLR